MPRSLEILESAFVTRSPSTKRRIWRSSGRARNRDPGIHKNGLIQWRNPGPLDQARVQRLYHLNDALAPTTAKLSPKSIKTSAFWSRARESNSTPAAPVAGRKESDYASLDDASVGRCRETGGNRIRPDEGGPFSTGVAVPVRPAAGCVRVVRLDRIVSGRAGTGGGGRIRGLRSGAYRPAGGYDAGSGDLCRLQPLLLHR